MSDEDIRILCEWFEKNKDHKLSFIEKEAVKMAVSKAVKVEDLLSTALKLLKKQ